MNQTTATAVDNKTTKATMEQTSTVSDTSTMEQTSVAAVDKHTISLLVGCFGFNGPLRQYFSLYQAVSQREGERGEKVGWLVVLGLTAL